MSVYVGISGWTYEGWRGTFYPPKLSHKKELQFASSMLPSIEINGTFYALGRPKSYAHWYQETPDNFVFSVKANRYITHINRLNDPLIPMANFFASGLLQLQNKLGPILWQFPPSLQFHPEKWERFLDLLPKDTGEAKKLARKTILPGERISIDIEISRPMRHAVEIRNDTFINPWFIDLLKQHKVALVFADTAGKWPYMEDITGDFLYLRLHGDSELYVSGYDDGTLDFWSKRLVQWCHGEEPKDRLTLTDFKASPHKRDAYVYFDNDAKVRAPVDARSLIKKLNVAGDLLPKNMSH